jgi:hypothetical protein
MNSTTQFWLNEPTILFNKNYIAEIWPNPNMSKERKLNAISRFVLVASILGYLVTLNMKLLFICIVTLAIIAVLYKVQANKEKNKPKEEVTKEGFENVKKINKLLEEQYTMPSNNNPMMNVLLPEISYNPKRQSGAPSFMPLIESDINSSTKNFVKDTFSDETNEEKESIKKKLFADLGDNYTFDDSMRVFYTTPNTQIPNDQGGFAQFCFGDMISSKENNPFALERNNPRLGAVIN